MADTRNPQGSPNASLGGGMFSGISDEDLQRLNDALAAMIGGNLDQMLGMDETRNWIDSPKMLEEKNMWRNTEYRPGGTGKVHFMGGSPYPMSRGQSMARDIVAGSDIATTLLDRLGAVLNSYMRSRRRKRGGIV